MTRAALIAAAACLLAPAPAGAAGGHPPVALSASPSRIRLAGTTGSETVRLTNPGTAAVVVDVARTGFALDPRGRPRVVAGTSGSRAWLAIRPVRIALPPLSTRTFTVATKLPAHAEPGDHEALVLLTTRPRETRGVAVRMRIGIVVTVRAPGAVVHRLEVGRLRVRRAGKARVVELALANRGNVTEAISPARIRLVLYRRGHRLATLRARPRELLPRTHGVVELRYGGRLRGPMTARVYVGGVRRRTVAIRL